MTKTPKLARARPESLLARLSAGNLGLWFVLAAVMLLYVVPIIMLIYGAFRSAAPGQPGHFTLTGFTEGFTDPQTWPTLLNSLWLGLVVGIFSTVVAAIAAWISANTVVWARRLMTPFMMLVLAMPPLFFALSWNLMGTPKLGMLNQMLAPIGIDWIDIPGAWGTAFVVGLKVSSLSYFMLIGPFRSMDRRMEEAALISGTGPLRTYFKVTLPLMAPALAGSFIVAFIIGLTAFEIPLIIGLGDGFNVFSTQIYSLMTATEPPNYGVAGALSVILIVIVIMLVAIRWWLLDRRTFTTLSGKGAPQEAWDLGRWAWLANTFIIGFILLGFVLPTAQMVLGSLQPIFGIVSNLSFDNYVRLLEDPDTIVMLGNSMTLAAIGGALAVLVAFALAYVGRHGSTAIRRMLDLATWMPWAANGILLGLGLVWTFLTVPFLTPLFGTIWILLAGLVIASTPLASRTVDAALGQIHRELEESGRVAGASALRVAGGIVGRLMLPAFLAGWFICAVHIVGNLEVTILLSLPTNPTIAVSVFQLYSSGAATTAAALFCLVLALGGVIGIVAWGCLRLSRMVRFRRLHAQLEASVDVTGDVELSSGQEESMSTVINSEGSNTWHQ